jgi:hypothetical protein
MLVLRSGSKPVAKRTFYSAVAGEQPVGRSRGDYLLRPAERLSRTPDAMQDDGELSGQRHPCFANTRSFGDRQRPILQFRRFLDPRHEAVQVFFCKFREGDFSVVVITLSG